MKQINLQIKGMPKSYPIIIGSNIISNFSKISRKYNLEFDKYLLVIDKNVPKKMIHKINKLIHPKKKIIHLL